MAYGQDGHFGICFQESMGTSFVDSMEFTGFVSETMTQTIEELVSESLSSRYEEPDDYGGMREIAGDIVGEVHPISFGKILKGWCGQEEVSYTESCYNHLFVPRTSDWTEEKAALPPMTIEVYRDTGSAYLYYDTMVDALNIEISQGALIKYTASFKGSQFDWSAKQTAAYDPGSFFAWDIVSISLAGNAMDEFSSLSMNFSNNLAGKAYLDGNKYASRILRDGFRLGEISGTLLLSGDTEARNFKNRTKQRLLVTITDPTTVMNHHNQLIIDIPQMVYTEFPANISGAGLVEVSFSAKAKYDSTSNYAMQFTLTNTQEAY